MRSELGEWKEIRLAEIGVVGAPKCSFRARRVCPPYTDEVCFEGAEGTQVEGHLSNRAVEGPGNAIRKLLSTHGGMSVLTSPNP